jgi:hypothetical protein
MQRSSAPRYRHWRGEEHPGLAPISPRSGQDAAGNEPSPEVADNQNSNCATAASISVFAGRLDRR